MTNTFLEKLSELSLFAWTRLLDKLFMIMPNAPCLQWIYLSAKCNSNYVPSNDRLNLQDQDNYKYVKSKEKNTMIYCKCYK